MYIQPTNQPTRYIDTVCNCIFFYTYCTVVKSPAESINYQSAGRVCGRCHAIAICCSYIQTPIAVSLRPQTASYKAIILFTKRALLRLRKMNIHVEKYSI